ncbi:uncharacterized protein [Chiloscyllium punctatum]|uniref:uncharacterized protein n=1 Tax=Chiloscyllium punctatum TaxID=137246 RepID=UPI003B6414A4
MYQPYNYRGGNNLYNELYLTLHFLLLEIRQRGSPQYTPMRSVSKWNMHYKQCCNFLASETVLLFAVVPYFYNYIGKNARVNNILYLATGESDFVIKILEILQGKNSQETGVKKVLEQASEFVIQKVHEFHYHKRTQCCKHKWVRQLSFTLQANKIVPNKSVVEFFQTSENLHQGIRNLPDKTENKTSIKCPDEPEVTCRIPAVGDYILTTPHMMGYIVSLPDPFVAEVRMDVVANTSSEFNDHKHYIYMDLRQLEWNETQSYWKPKIAMKHRFTSWAPGEEGVDLKFTNEDTQEACEKFKVKKKLKKYSAAVNSGTKIVPTATSNLTEISGTSKEQKEQAKNKESQPDSAYEKNCFEAWKRCAPKTLRNRRAVVKNVCGSREKLPLKKQPRRETGRSVPTMPGQHCITRTCNVDSQSSSSYKSHHIYAPQDPLQYRVGRKRFSTVQPHSNQNQEQTELEVQHANCNAEQKDKLTKAAIWESIQIKGKSLMSTLERDNLQSAEMGKLSYLSLQCEEKEKIPPNIGTKLMDENEKACSESQANCKSKVMSTVFADCIENSQTSEKQNEEVKNKESFNRPDSVSSYQEECIEAWKSTSPETSEHTVKSANDLHEKFIPENQLKRETCRTLSIISLNGFTVASKTSLPFKSDNIYGPQNLQLHRKDRKRNSTLHSLSKQNEMLFRRLEKPCLCQKRIALAYLKMDPLQLNERSLESSKRHFLAQTGTVSKTVTKGRAPIPQPSKAPRDRDKTADKTQKTPTVADFREIKNIQDQLDDIRQGATGGESRLGWLIGKSYLAHGIVLLISLTLVFCLGLGCVKLCCKVLLMQSVPGAVSPQKSPKEARTP